MAVGSGFGVGFVRPNVPVGAGVGVGVFVAIGVAVAVAETVGEEVVVGTEVGVAVAVADGVAKNVELGVAVSESTPVSASSEVLLGKNKNAARDKIKTLTMAINIINVLFSLPSPGSCGVASCSISQDDTL